MTDTDNNSSSTATRRSSPLWHWLVIGGAFLVVLNFSTIRDTVGGPIDYRADTAGPVTLYSTTWCGYCRKVRRLLTRHEIPFEELDIEANAAASRQFTQLGGRGVPVVTVGDRVVHGYNYSRLRTLLECGDCP